MTTSFDDISKPCEHFGISIYDNQSSCAISSAHGYVGAPANMRASNLNYYSTLPNYNEPAFTKLKQVIL